MYICISIYIYIYIYIYTYYGDEAQKAETALSAVRYSSLVLQSFGFMFKLSTLSRKSHVSLLCILNSLSSLSPLAWLE